MEKLGAVRQLLEAGALDAALSRLTGGDPRRDRAVGVLEGFRTTFGAGEDRLESSPERYMMG